MNAVLAAALELGRWTPLDVFVKATLFLIAGLAVYQLVWRRAAALRHVVLAGTFGALLVLPVVVAFGSQVPVHVRVKTAAPAVRVARAAEASYPVAQGGGVRASFPWQMAVAATWGVGTLVMLAALLFDLWRLGRLRRHGIPAPAELRVRMQGLAADAGIRRRVDLLLLPEIQGPFTCGLFEPAILLPDDARSWVDEELRRALVHELEHIRRGDWAVQLMARATCSLYWFHPLVWAAWRRLCLEAERACDDAVLRVEESTAYAEQLVSLARRMTHGPEVPALGMARRSDLSERVRAVLEVGRSRQRVGVAAALVTLTAGCVLALAVGPVRAVAQSVRSVEGRRASAVDKALVEAAEKGDNDDVQQLVAAGANVNAVVSGDGSPLIAATRAGKDETVRLLLDRGADPNVGVDGDGSPLIMAALRGHLSTARLLLDRGADVRKPVIGDGNPLIMAARGGSVEMVEFLLSRGADIEQIVPQDENALIEASAGGQIAVVKLLVGRGANVNSRAWAPSDMEWRTPLKMALRNKRSEIADYLRSVGARE